MRNGVGAEFPHHDRFSGAQASHGFAAPQVFVAQPTPAQSYAPPYAQPYSNTYRAADAQRSNIARLFLDLRAALRATPQQLALHLQTAPNTLLALEGGDFERLPAWSETARIVIAYTALAGIDGRPVLAAIADTIQRSSHVLELPPPAPHREPAPDLANQLLVHEISPVSQPAIAPNRAEPPTPPVEARSQPTGSMGRLFAAGSALANGAKLFPAGALQQVRERPQRALYAVSLPLGIVLLMLNTSALEAAFSNVPRPVARVAQDVRSYFQVQFAPVREGLRWIEVDDPRRRRSDKLR